MALFKRVNLNSLSVLNHCYNKIATSTVKLKTNKHVAISSSVLNEKLNKQDENTEKLTNSKFATFENEMILRRNQACRSILVQVHSLSSHRDLQNYCAQFGIIQSVHHYRTNKQRNYILVEFENEESVRKVISSSSFMDADLIVPVRSKVLWFRKDNVASNLKSNDRNTVSYTENDDPTAKQVAYRLYHSKSISGQILYLYDMLKLNDLETRLRFHTANHLEQYFSGLFCKMRVLPFGSSINGFGRKKCDLDLVLVPANIKEDNVNSRLIFHSKTMRINERYETKEFMGILASSMQHFIPGVENLRRILEARVPIIKFNFEYTRLECDLSTTNMSAVYMSELLHLYGEIDWRVRPLVSVIRNWAKVQEITCDSPGPWITNFSLSLLVLFYFQQKNILPSLRMLKTYATRDDIRHTENGIDCTFLRDINKLPNEYKYKSNQENLEALLLDFFEFYSLFDFYTKGICIREGIPIRKPSRLPLHIVNPLETTLNVAKNVTIYELNRLKEKAHDAIFILETSDKSNYINWGIMNLLKIKYIDTIGISQLNMVQNVTPEEKNSRENIEDNIQESHSQEISEKITNNNDIQPKKKTKTV
ncbi:Poly(A) RNA polymerase, mitochondrial [Harpegnathos saltator]|uniref:Poly(A) RNA polymerase, mitochondrial n=1 Tax=Harpegnathos saltator TaxID=610380 RepID=E2C3E6_HARSA|nr:Poly(A) RNA polymerase, mitochondrial [Harpegnathos saltator]